MLYIIRISFSIIAINWRQNLLPPRRVASDAYIQLYPVTTRLAAGIVLKAQVSCLSLSLIHFSSDSHPVHQGLRSESGVMLTLTHGYI